MAAKPAWVPGMAASSARTIGGIEVGEVRTAGVKVRRARVMALVCMVAEAGRFATACSVCRGGFPCCCGAVIVWKAASAGEYKEISAHDVGGNHGLLLLLRLKLSYQCLGLRSLEDDLSIGCQLLSHFVVMVHSIMTEYRVKWTSMSLWGRLDIDGR